jgi:hypothetical protein
MLHNMTLRAPKKDSDDELVRLKTMADAGSPHAKSLLAALADPPSAGSDEELSKILEAHRAADRGEARWVAGAEVTEMIARWRREALGG